MEESKELQKLYGFMQAFIYITVCIEILLFVHFPFSEQIMPLLSKMAKIPIYSNILYSKLFTFFIIMVTCIGTRSKKDLEKLISLCERIIDDCADLKIHQDAVHYLCDAYVANNQREKAVALVENIVLPYETIERSWLLETVYESEKRIEQSQDNLIALVEWTVNQLIELSTNREMGPELTVDEKIKFAQAALNIYRTIFYGGHTDANNGSFRHIYERMSELYLGKGDTENGVKYLKLSAEAAEYYDKSCENGSKYNSLFVNRLSADKQEHYVDTVRLLQLMDKRAAFDVIRKTDEFKQIHAHLETLSPKE